MNDRMWWEYWAEQVSTARGCNPEKAGEDAGATPDASLSPAAGNTAKPGAHHLTPESIAATIADLRAIEAGTESIPVEDRDHRTQAGVLARIIEHLSGCGNDAEKVAEKTAEQNPKT